MATVFPDRTKLLGRIVTGRAASIGLADATRSFPAVGALRRTAALMTPRTANIRCWSRLGATRCGASTLRRHVTARDLSGARRARHAKVQNRSDRGASFIARSAMPPRKKPPTPGSGGKGRQLGLFESFQRDTPSKRRRRSVLSRATIAADILSNSNAHHASSEPLTSSPLNHTPRINQVRRRRHRPGIQQVPARIRHLHRQVHRDRGRPRRVQRTRHERGRHPTIRSRVRRRVRRPTPQPARPGPAAPLLRAPPLHPRPPARAHEARRRRRRPGRSRCALAASPGPRSRRGGQALSPSRHGRLPRDPAYAPHRAHRHRGLHRLEDGGQ